MNTRSQVNIVVALSAEAHPLIGHFRLKRMHDISSFEVYANETMKLIVSGMGKTNAATATGFLAGLSAKDAARSWLNVGIAGGNIAEFGDVVIANSILDQETGQKYFPTLCFEHDLDQVELVTVNEPCDRYLENALYDMEASAYFAAASKFSSVELVHSCKIVTDNSKMAMGNIDKELVIKIVERNLQVIDLLINTITSLANQAGKDDRLESLFRQLILKFHFTESQKNTLRLYLQNYFALNENFDVIDDDLKESNSASTYLQSLKHLIDSAPVSY